MKKIFIDTNFLLLPAQYGVDIFEEINKICHFQFELYVLKESIEELENIIRDQRGKYKDRAKIGLAIIEHKLKQKSLNIITFSKESNVDDILVSIADNNNYIATQDKGLKRRVKDKGSKVIILRAKKYLEIK